MGLVHGSDDVLYVFVNVSFLCGEQTYWESACIFGLCLWMQADGCGIYPSDSHAGNGKSKCKNVDAKRISAHSGVYDNRILFDAECSPI